MHLPRRLTPRAGSVKAGAHVLTSLPTRIFAFSKQVRARRWACLWQEGHSTQREGLAPGCLA